MQRNSSVPFNMRGFRLLNTLLFSTVAVLFSSLVVRKCGRLMCGTVYSPVQPATHLWEPLKSPDFSYPPRGTRRLSVLRSRVAISGPLEMYVMLIKKLASAVFSSEFLFLYYSTILCLPTPFLSGTRRLPLTLALISLWSSMLRSDSVFLTLSYPPPPPG